MKFIPNRFKHNGLFIIMFLLTVTIVIIVSISISWATLRMSEKFFVEKFSITNSKVMNQISDKFESYHDSIVIASTNILQSSTVKRVLTEKATNIEKMRSFYNLDQQMKYIRSNLDSFEAEILISGINGVNYTTNRSYWPITDEELTESDLIKQTRVTPKKIVYQYYQLKSDASNNKERFIVASRALKDPFSMSIYGSMFFVISEREFRNFYANYTGAGNDVYLIDKSGVIFSSNQSELIGQMEPELLQHVEKISSSKDQYIIEEFMGKEQIVLMKYLPSFDMYLFNIIDEKQAVGGLFDKKSIFMICMTIVLIALIAIFLLSRMLTNSLSRLVKQISNASQNKFHQYVTVGGIYETRQIGRAFNAMLDELHEYVDQLLLAQKHQRNAELEALQQQINPHFLYNTLTSIKFTVQQGEKKEADAIINSLISLLQNTIGNVSETVTIDQEIENLQSYVFINQKRYGSRINVQYFIDPKCRQYQIPKLLLQPFVENAFFHAFTLKNYGYIHILVWSDKNYLICEVVDNGDGMEFISDKHLPDTKRNQQLFKGIGIRNVNDRIGLLYGEPFGVDISSTLGEGTKVKIMLPILKTEVGEKSEIE
ncbi:sensor histidine kinase [Niallia sp. NCCP-28]|uniref:sensor histidine kinase n=1 Tax=Niallia sp. NCCP-28 TaxID=2934712 RepID=UPI00208C4565|nr:sensor histidine kinase [Niallia sp. NCCP-28]GKU82158.1 histidine kinase [Niallia sp. NCCP-28]